MEPTMMHSAKLGLAALALVIGTASGLAHAAEGARAGEVTLMTGRGTASSADGAVRTLSTGDAVYSGEIVSSGSNSYVSLKFVDGGLVLLRPRTRFEIQQYAFTPAAAAAAPPPVAPVPNAPGKIGGGTPAIPPPPAAPAVTTASSESGGSTRAFFRLLKGSFRAVSGLIGKGNQDDYRVSTPVATIGIRGTDYFAQIIDASFAKDPVLKASLPAGASAEGGLYVEQFEGTTVITNNAGKQSFVGAGQHLVTLSGGTQLNVPRPKVISNDPPKNPKDMKCNQ